MLGKKKKNVEPDEIVACVWQPPRLWRIGTHSVVDQRAPERVAIGFAIGIAIGRGSHKMAPWATS